MSKQVSEYIDRLQKHNFKWEDKSFNELYKEYPRCKAALKWWCNSHEGKSRFNINYNKGLKEFLIENPPKFKISSRCCKGAKKDTVHDFEKNKDFDLSCIGVRKAEGGVRASSYKNCFTKSKDKIDQYRPIFWYKNETKEIYEKFFNIKHSKCYEEYGLKRTGCCGCPYGKNLEDELKIMKEHEPKLYIAACNVFKDSYEYTRAYKEFKETKNKEN